MGHLNKALKLSNIIIVIYIFVYNRPVHGVFMDPQI